MKLACLSLLTAAILTAAPEVTLGATRAAHLLVLKEVYLNGQGPFRMMVDTGAATCMVRPAVARKLGLRPTYAVDQVTAAGVVRVPALVLDEVRTGAAADPSVEVLVTDLHFSGVDGVLGESWLVRHDYLLDYRNRRLVLDPAAVPASGIRAALRSSDGRPGILAEVDGRRQDLVLDSGASDLVLFGNGRLVTAARLTTNTGAIEVSTSRVRLTIGDGYRQTVTAALVNAEHQAGLLPTASFASVYVSNREGVVVLVP